MKKIVAAVLLMLVGLLGSIGVVSADPAPDQVAVCCAWGTQLGDNDLTYRIRAKDAGIAAAMADAVEDWETAVPGLTLTILMDKNTKADIHHSI